MSAVIVPRQDETLTSRDSIVMGHLTNNEIVERWRTVTHHHYHHHRYHHQRRTDDHRITSIRESQHLDVIKRPYVSRICRHFYKARM